MPKTLPEKIIFTIIMAAIMVYGMIVYNVALNTGGVTNATFVMALHEMPGGNAAVQGAELRHLGAHLGLQHAHGPVLADAVLWPAEPYHFPAAVPPQ